MYSVISFKKKVKKSPTTPNGIEDRYKTLAKVSNE